MRADRETKVKGESIIGKNQGYHGQDRKIPSCDMYNLLNDTTRFAKQHEFVLSAYTVLSTGIFPRKHIEEGLKDERI